MKTIIEMAREAGLWPAVTDVFPKELKDFSDLVRADEREACAKVCELLPPEWADQDGIAQAEKVTMLDCAAAIRARGNT